MAKIPFLSKHRPLLNESGAPGEQATEFFNLLAQFTTESDGDPNGIIDPIYIGQTCVDVTNEDAYINVNGTNTGWKAVT